MADRPSIDSRLFLREESLLEGWARLATASRRLDDRLATEAAALDLPFTAAQVLLLLAAREGVDGKRIEHLLARPRATIAPRIALLARRGLIRRRIARDDRRRRELYLTSEGAALARRMFRRLAPLMATAYRGAGAGAVEGFQRVLDRLGPESPSMPPDEGDARTGSNLPASRS